MKNKEKENCAAKREARAEGRSGSGDIAIKNEGLKKLPFRIKESGIFRYISCESGRGHTVLFSLKALVYFFLGVIYSGREVLFSTYPFALVLLCASGGFMPAAAVGVFIGGIAGGEKGLPYAAATVIVLSLRSLYTILPHAGRSGRHLPLPVIMANMYNEGRTLKLTTAAISAFFVGIYSVIKGGYRFYDLFGCLFLLTFVPLCVFLSTLKEKKELGKNLYFLLYSLFSLSVIYSLAEVRFFAVNAGAVAGAVWTFAVARRRGLAHGTAFSILAALPLGIDAVPVLAVSAAVAGGLCEKKLKGTTFGAAAGMTASYILLGAEGVLKFFPPLIAAVPLTEGVIYLISYLTPPQAEENELITNIREEERIARISESFSALSEVCYALSDRYRRPDELELYQLCRSACDRHCTKCEKTGLCWEREYSSTKDVINKAVAVIARGDELTPSALPPYYLSRCRSSAAICADINKAVGALTKRKLTGDKSEVFAKDYSSVSKVLKEALAVSRLEEEIDREGTERLSKALSGLMSGGRATLRGKRKRRVEITLMDPAMARERCHLIRRRCEETIGCVLDEGEIKDAGGYSSISFTAQPAFSVACEKLCRPKGKNSACGDTVSQFENREQYFYSMLSDGMGTGKDAALVSAVATVFLRKMLSAGNKKSTSLEMLNDLLCSQYGESTTTVDLLEVDMITGEAAFVKSGAAPSFLLRKGRIFRVQSKTMPIGILRAADAEQVRFLCEDGDIIVMLSDGVVGGFEECGWLLRLLSRSKGADLHVLCRRILDEAEKNRRAPHDDDSSVAIVKVEKTC